MIQGTNQTGQITSNMNQATNQARISSNVNQNLSAITASKSALLPNLIASLRTGDSFVGTVTDITPSLVTIEVGDIGIIQAKYNEVMNLHIGDTMKFLVQEKNEQQLVIKPFPNEVSQLKSDSQNVFLSPSLLAKYPDASKEVLTLMLKNHLTINRDTISAFEQLLDNKAPFTETINKILNIVENNPKIKAEIQDGLQAQVKEMPFRDEKIAHDIINKDLERLLSISTKEHIPEELIKKTKEIKATLEFLKDLSTVKEHKGLQAQINYAEEYLRLQDDFINELNFFALPVNIQENQTELKIYVNDGNRKKQNKKTSSVSLKLKTEHLGDLTIHVRMDENNFHAGFQANSDYVTALLKNNFHLLTDALALKGLELKADAETIKEEEHLSFSRDVLHENITPNETDIIGMKRVVFDVRT